MFAVMQDARCSLFVVFALKSNSSLKCFQKYNARLFSTDEGCARNVGKCLHFGKQASGTFPYLFWEIIIFLLIFIFLLTKFAPEASGHTREP